LREKEERKSDTRSEKKKQREERNKMRKITRGNGISLF
jgi:hypothetical protein